MVRGSGTSDRETASLAKFVREFQRLSKPELALVEPSQSEATTAGSSLASFATFLARFRELSSPNSTSLNKAEDAPRYRLETFLVEFSRLRRDVPPEPQRPAEVIPDQETLRNFLEHFRRLSEASIRSGEQIDIWSISGLGKNEVRNASVLAWLLDKRQTHGKGAAILQALLDRLSKRHVGEFPLSVDDAKQYRVSTEHYSLDNDANRVDIVIDGSDFTAFIEVKIAAREGEEQIDRYLDLLERRAKALGRDRIGLVFLTRSGDKPRNVVSPRVIIATWDDVARAIEETIKRQQSGGTTFVDRLLTQFAQHIARF
ncbi:PD-(D/E)XK nuclease family protein [Microvirga sp. BT688]|uniref:PDDEXK-like family protein n=1 Tax=Microvirga sp. TaxID=1873136 RepID=UPI001687C9B5|nr:PD-(D/E)XK nuclease family protein [Microvirga sp.]MBD2745797.1 PD-(D/E)XK nuclease family protein [Microvirga sp.]